MFRGLQVWTSGVWEVYVGLSSRYVAFGGKMVVAMLSDGKLTVGTWKRQGRGWVTLYDFCPEIVEFSVLPHEYESTVLGTLPFFGVSS